MMTDTSTRPAVMKGIRWLNFASIAVFLITIAIILKKVGTYYEVAVLARMYIWFEDPIWIVLTSCISAVSVLISFGFSGDNDEAEEPVWVHLVFWGMVAAGAGTLLVIFISWVIVNLF